jgi:hypothetical protein
LSSGHSQESPAALPWNIAGGGDFRRCLGEQCGDVFLYLLMVCERAGINLAAAADAKIDANARGYSADMVGGNARKQSEL